MVTYTKPQQRKKEEKRERAAKRIERSDQVSLS